MATLTPSETSLRDKAMQALNQLPPFSPTLNKLMATLAKEDVFLSEISAIIEKDTVLAGQVLKMVNSALYARSGTVNSVRHAVAILGLNKLRNLALSLSVTRMWRQMKAPKSWSQAEFNMHSVATAIMADLLAQRLNVNYPEGAFTGGLLHSIGKLLIALGLPAQYEQILTSFRTNPHVSMEDWERETIGATNCELAAMALEHWKLPAEITRAVGALNQPYDDAGGRMDLSRLLWLAHEIVNRLNIVIPACPATPEPPAEAILAELGLEAQAQKILDDFKREYDAIKSFF